MGILHVTNLEDYLFPYLLSALKEIGPVKSYYEYDDGDMDIKFEEKDHLQKALDQVDELSYKIHAEMPVVLSINEKM